MPQLYVACRTSAGLIVKHVQLANQLQQQVLAVFQAQDAAFLDGINNEIPFDGDWTPDSDELLVANGVAEAQVLLDATMQNAIALPVLDVANFQTEGVRGLFTTVGQGAQRRILLQSFSPQQLLAGRFSLLHDGNVFRRLVEPAFSLDTKLVATIDVPRNVRFKSFHMLRRILDLSLLYQQATDADLNAFCIHGSLSVADPAAFVADADEGMRKAVHAITTSNVLGLHTVAQISAQALAIGFAVGVSNNRIEVPQDRRHAKELFSFLLDKVYRGPMNQQLLITNSRRPL